MRIISTVLAGLAGLGLAAGSAGAQDSKSWGPSHTTYWSSDATGRHEPGKFMEPQMTPPAAVQPTAGQRQMNYQAMPKRAKAKMVRQPQARLRQQQPTTQPGAPPAQGAQPPAEAKPSAPPSQGQPEKPATPK